MTLPSTYLPLWSLELQNKVRRKKKKTKGSDPRISNTHICVRCTYIWAPLVVQTVKNLPSMQETWVYKLKYILYEQQYSENRTTEVIITLNLICSKDWCFIDGCSNCSKRGPLHQAPTTPPSDLRSHFLI